jgi:hypothetical protein
MSNQELIAQLESALAALKAVQEPPTDYSDFPNGPKLMAVQGHLYMLRAPINEKWLPSLNDFVFGGANRVQFDPSNAPAGVPSRDEHGYPLFYALAPDPTDTNWPPRSIPAPGWKPRLLDYGQTWDSYEALVRARDVSRPLRDANLAKWQEQMRTLQYHGPFDANQITDAQAAYLYEKHNEYRDATKGQLDQIWMDLLGGYWSDICRVVNRGELMRGEAENIAISDPVKLAIDTRIITG